MKTLPKINTSRNSSPLRQPKRVPIKKSVSTTSTLRELMKSEAVEYFQEKSINRQILSVKKLNDAEVNQLQQNLRNQRVLIDSELEKLISIKKSVIARQNQVKKLENQCNEIEQKIQYLDSLCSEMDLKVENEYKTPTFTVQKFEAKLQEMNLKLTQRFNAIFDLVRFEKLCFEIHERSKKVLCQGVFAQQLRQFHQIYKINSTKFTVNKARIVKLLHITQSGEFFDDSFSFSESVPLLEIYIKQQENETDEIITSNIAINEAVQIIKLTGMFMSSELIRTPKIEKLINSGVSEQSISQLFAKIHLSKGSLNTCVQHVKSSYFSQKVFDFTDLDQIKTYVKYIQNESIIHVDRAHDFEREMTEINLCNQDAEIHFQLRFNELNTIKQQFDDKIAACTAELNQLTKATQYKAQPISQFTDDMLTDIRNVKYLVQHDFDGFTFQQIKLQDEIFRLEMLQQTVNKNLGHSNKKQDAPIKVILKHFDDTVSDLIEQFHASYVKNPSYVTVAKREIFQQHAKALHDAKMEQFTNTTAKVYKEKKVKNNQLLQVKERTFLQERKVPQKKLDVENQIKQNALFKNPTFYD